MGARKKIMVVGAVNVGADVPHWLAAKERGDVEPVDIVEGVPARSASSGQMPLIPLLELVNTSPTPIIFLKREPLFVGATLAEATG